MKIVFEFDALIGYNGPVVACNDEEYFCSCSNCEPSCKGSVKLNLTENTQCHIKMFGEDWLCLEVGMAASYYVFVVFALVIVSIVTSHIAKEKNKENLYQNNSLEKRKNVGVGIGICFLILGIVLMIVSFSIAHLKHSCSIELFGSNWNCTSAYLLLTGMILSLLGGIIISFVTCFAYIDLIPRTKLKSSNTNGHFEDNLNLIQRFFYKFGSVIASSPKITILVCVLIVAGLYHEA